MDPSDVPLRDSPVRFLHIVGVYTSKKSTSHHCLLYDFSHKRKTFLTYLFKQVLLDYSLISPMLEESHQETLSLEDRVCPLEESTNFNLMRIEGLEQCKVKSPNGKTIITIFDNKNELLDSSNKLITQATQR